MDENPYKSPQSVAPRKRQPSSWNGKLVVIGIFIVGPALVLLQWLVIWLLGQ